MSRLLTIIVGVISSMFLSANAYAKSPETQINCIAENIYHEAKGEPHSGQVAVANVVMNRVNDKRFPSTPCAVVNQKTKGTCQFSWVCSGKRAIRNIKIFAEAKRIAEDVYYGRQSDVTNGSKFFHSTSVSPRWKRSRTLKIGRHIFYR